MSYRYWEDPDYDLEEELSKKDKQLESVFKSDWDKVRRLRTDIEDEAEDPSQVTDS